MWSLRLIFQWRPFEFFFQKQSSFKAPYNSDKIGFNEVSEISVVKGIWDVKDIDSKCLCLPNHPQHPNPLPSNVLDILSRRNATPFLVTSALSIAYQKSTPSWSISTLLLPGKYVWKLLLVCDERILFLEIKLHLYQRNMILFISEVNILIEPTIDEKYKLKHFAHF